MDRMKAVNQFVVNTTSLVFALLIWGAVLGEIPSMAQSLSAIVQPASVTLPTGSNAAVTFCLQVQGVPPFTFQWQKNGVSLVGETNQCLTLTNIVTADGGSYRALVSNSAESRTSEEGWLMINVKSLPGADGFTNSQPISAISNTVQGLSFGSSREVGEPFHANLRTSNSVWYVWKAPVSGIVTFDTRGSTFDTVLAVYTGSTLSGLRELTSDDDSGGFHASRVQWNAQGGTEYRIAIDGVTGETGAYICRWNLEVTLDHIPQWVRKPRSQSVIEGYAAQFDAVVQDPDGPLSYQWFHNGNPIPDQNTSTLKIPRVSSVDMGEYVLAVTNGLGRGIQSPPASLEIGPVAEVISRDKLAELPSEGAPAPRALLADATSVGTFSLAAGTILRQRFFNAGTTDRCEPAHCSVPGGASRWFQLVAASDGICTIDTTGSDVDTLLAVYLQNFAICTNLYEPLVDCNNDSFGTCEQLQAQDLAGMRGSRLSFQATAGTVYRAVVDTVRGVRGTNIHFNVQFQSSQAVSASPVTIGNTAQWALETRGASLELAVASDFQEGVSQYQWHFNQRRIAGAVQPRLLLPILNYSDSGQYSVTVFKGTNTQQLPPVVLAVMDPCQTPSLERVSLAGTERFRLWGATPEPILLETTTDLHLGTGWQPVGRIPASSTPTQWTESSSPFQFYRFSRPEP